MCFPVCSSTVIGCTYDLPSGIYNMYVYDIEEENTLSDGQYLSSMLCFHIYINGCSNSNYIATHTVLKIMVYVF